MARRTPTPIEHIPKTAAIQSALDFISFYEEAFAHDRFDEHGFVIYTVALSDFEKLSKVLLAGIGELAK